MAKTAVVVLAAGQGTRMRSRLPKVLHPVNGVPMVTRVTGLVKGISSKTVIVVPRENQAIKDVLGKGFLYAVQHPARGTGHAVKQTQGLLKNFRGNLLILYADGPVLRKETVKGLLQAHENSGAAATFIAVELSNPTGYGRVVRDAQGRVEHIVEELDCTDEQRRIRESYTGVVCYRADKLWKALNAVKPANAKKEYYLTDVIHLLIGQGETVATAPGSEEEVLGVNNRVQLAQAAGILRRRVLEELMLQGVTIEDPQTTYVEEGARIGADTVLRPFTMIDRRTTIGRGCQIGPFAVIRGCRLGEGVRIFSSTLDDSVFKDGVQVGPYSRVRGGAVLDEKVYVGNFAEIKHSKIGQRSMMCHFSYLGDATVGHDSNLSAGIITANFDGKNKNRTVIGNKAFIGCDTTLVAPVKIGDGAKTGAGSVVLKNRNVKAGQVVAGIPARPIRSGKK